MIPALCNHWSLRAGGIPKVYGRRLVVFSFGHPLEETRNVKNNFQIIQWHTAKKTSMQGGK